MLCKIPDALYLFLQIIAHSIKGQFYILFFPQCALESIDRLAKKFVHANLGTNR
jgi:hypothetical protein